MPASRHLLALAALAAPLLIPTAALAAPDDAVAIAHATGAGWLAPAGALAIGLTGLGAALGQGRAVATAMDGMARNPGAAARLRGAMILGLAMIESLVVLITVFLMTKM